MLNIDSQIIMSLNFSEEQITPKIIVAVPSETKPASPNTPGLLPLPTSQFSPLWSNTLQLLEKNVISVQYVPHECIICLQNRQPESN